jgi:hypothetical protein
MSKGIVYSQVITWMPNKGSSSIVKEDIDEITKKLTIASSINPGYSSLLSSKSSVSFDWSIDFDLKVQNVKQKDDKRIMGGKSSSGTELEGSFKKRARDDDKIQQSFHFCRFNDSIDSYLCILPKDIKIPQDVIIGSYDLEDIISTTSDLQSRSTWKANGTRFLIGDFIISVGYLQQSLSSIEPILEIMYSPEIIDDNITMNDISIMTNDIINDILPISVVSSVKTLKNSTSTNSLNSNASLVLAIRALQWGYLL